jgi:hypothetical protein
MSRESTAMPRLFISYRRSDTQMVAGRLRESLARRLGERAIFRDKNSLAAGEDWTKAISDALSGDVVVLALIGPTWATITDSAGRRRLDDPGDWNRVELERAFAGCSRVIPLLVDDARMPAECDLPDSLKGLAHSMALKLRDDDWDSDIERLVQAIGRIDAPAFFRRPAIAAALAASIVLTAGAGYWFVGSNGEPEGGTATNQPGTQQATGPYRRAIIDKLSKEQYDALDVMRSDMPKAIRLVDENLAGIAQALKSFPDEADLYALAGFGAKNVYASSKGVLSPEVRKQYLVKARMSFEQALRIDPKNAGAVNGMGNVLFYEGRFDDALRQHQEALNLTGGNYDGRSIRRQTGARQ